MEEAQFLIDILRQYGYAAIGFGILIECMGIPFPGETLLVLGAVGASLGHLNIFIVIAVAALGAIIGDNFGYMIGRKFGRKVIKKYEHLPIFHFQHIERVEKYFKKHGNKTVFLGRFTALLRTYVALFAGIFDMHYPTFFFYNLTGGIVWAIVFGVIGYMVGNNLGLMWKVITQLNYIIFVIIGLVITYFVAKHFLARRQKHEIN